MSTVIRMQKAGFEQTAFNGNGYMAENLLADEITGVETRYAAVDEGYEHNSIPDAERVHILFIIGGFGSIRSGGKLFEINEMTVFVSALCMGYSITSSKGRLEYLEISYKLKNDEIEAILQKVQDIPCCKAYSKCSTYSEAIKSDRTINRTILDENTIPRFCMGSVETVGPDEVGAHSHPMLEQLFFGLPGNSCLVIADESEAYFSEGMLLHIPPGSSHSVRVEAGRKLHYLWMDFFKSSDMSYITESHKKLEYSEE